MLLIISFVAFFFLYFSKQEKDEIKGKNAKG